MLHRAAQHVAHRDKARLAVLDDAAVGRNLDLAVGEGVEGVDGLVRRRAGLQMDDDARLARGEVFDVAHLDLALLHGLDDGGDEGVGGLAIRNFGDGEGAVVHLLYFGRAYYLHRANATLTEQVNNCGRALDEELTAFTPESGLHYVKVMAESGQSIYSINIKFETNYDGFIALESSPDYTAYADFEAEVADHAKAAKDKKNGGGSNGSGGANGAGGGSNGAGGDSMAGIGYVIETYGIIYNKALLEKAGYTQDDIKSFDDLKKVAEDITARKDELGFSAFTSAGMDGSSDWRFKTHLANLPIYYEYKADDINTTDAIKGTYLDNYRNIWDLYINNATCDPSLLSTKTGDDAVAEFVTEQAVFYQNGTWAYNDVAELGDDKLGMLPIYIGAEGEDKQGLCTGTENYWCVNSKASEADIQATLDCMYWCVTSEVGTKAMCGGEGAMPSGDAGMGFVIPFKGNLESSNPLVNIANQYVADGYTPVAWTFSTMPSEEWKNGVGSALTTYAADQTDDNWAAVVSAFVDGWAKEAAASK